MSQPLDAYDPWILYHPWVVFDGTTAEAHMFRTSAEAHAHAQHLIEESHDGETWDEGVEQTFVALIVAKAVEVPIDDEKSDYRLCPVEPPGVQP